MTKCLTCNKKLKLVFEIKGKCRCDNTYCSKHIQTHKCTFDYKTLQKNQITRENPIVVPEKVNRI
jgi:hypothetical protein